MKRLRSSPAAFLVLALVSLTASAHDARAASASAIDADVDKALQRFYEQVPGGQDFTRNAKGTLVFPHVVAAGFGIGGEFGTGALRVGGKTIDYYSTTAASIGFQIGAQSKTVILCFMTDKALEGFRKGKGWEVGIDGSVAIVDVGAGGSLDTRTAAGPVVGFVFGRSGLMANVSLEGAKMTKIRPE